MTAVDTNILVYAHDPASPYHPAALLALQALAAGPLPWAIPWPCAYEFLRVITHPAVLRTPLLLGAAWERLRDIINNPGVTMLAETSRHAEVLASVL